MVVGITLLALGLAAVHLLAGKLRFVQVIPRSQWLSLAGGVSLAYVFVHLLPEVTERQAELVEAGEAAHVLWIGGERALFVVALAGFAVFYGLERYAVRTRHETEGSDEVADGAETKTPAETFWIHIGSFSAYNALIGYLLLHREETGVASLLFYFVAMALHFFVNDFGLVDHHRDAYERIGRWVLAAAVVVGFLVGVVVTVPESVLGLLFAFLGGGIVLNVIKEELPEERQSRFGAFATGATLYTAVLLAV